MLISHSPRTVPARYLAKIEAGEWIATLGGYGAISPTENDGFFGCTQPAQPEEVYEAIKDAERIAYLCPSNHCQQAAPYRKSNASSGLCSFRDAVCALCLSTVKE